MIGYSCTILILRGLIPDEDPVDEKELQPISNKTDGGLLYTYQIFNHKFTWQDSGKKLRCVIVSEALGKDDEKEIAQPINVYCKLPEKK